VLIWVANIAWIVTTGHLMAGNRINDASKTALMFDMRGFAEGLRVRRQLLQGKSSQSSNMVIIHGLLTMGLGSDRNDILGNATPAR
jgi:hypothetical protein